VVRSPNRRVEEDMRDVPIEDYLDKVYAPLVKVVPYARRQELRKEIRGHLEALMDGYEELGHSPEAAALAALQQFGDPDVVGRRWAAEHCQRLGKAIPTALVSSVLAAQLAVAVLVRAPYVLGPPSYPNGRSSLVEIGCFLLPGIAGLLAGVMTPLRRVLGFPIAVAAMILPVAALARLAESYLVETVGVATCMFEMAVMQFFLWLILGTATANFSESLRNPSSVRRRWWTVR
jgi:hypothetical protein